MMGLCPLPLETDYVFAKLNSPSLGLQDKTPKALPLLGLRFCHPCTHTTNALTTVQLSHGEKELHFLRQGYLPRRICLHFSVQLWEVPRRIAEGDSGRLADGEV